MTADVSVIGLGAMGSAMARHLAKTRTVVGFDVAVDKLRAASDIVTPAGSVGEAASAAPVVVVSVRDGAQLHEVADAAAGTMAPGSVLLVTSTVGADPIRAVAAQLAAHSVHVLDAPVSGGPVRAGEGDLLILVGGAGEALRLGQPVLDALGSTVVVVGGVGDGQNFKTVNQLLCGIHTAAAAEALALAHRLGLDLDQVIDILGKGAAASFMLADRGPRMAQRLRGDEPPLRSRLDIIAKDMGIVGDLTRTSRVAAPVAAAAEELYRIGMAMGLAAEDDSVMATVLGV